MSKQIFFKTVRNDYKSVWAIGKHCRQYKVGTRHKFNPLLPAHVFGLNEDGNLYPKNSGDVFPVQDVDDHDYIYMHRSENTGTRVVICYGEVKAMSVPVCEVRDDWDFRFRRLKLRWTSNDFVVLAEIKPKKRDKQDYLGYNFVTKRDKNEYGIFGDNYASV